MKITAIKRQQRRSSRFSIFVDEKYSFSLSEDELYAQALKVDQELDKAQLKALKELSGKDKLYAKTLNLLSIRPRSEKELVDYLKRAKADSPLIQEILNKLSIKKFVDDEAFARMWVENRRRNRLASHRRLQMELRQKGISESIIKQALADDTEEETAALAKLIAVKSRQSRYQDRLKLMQYLVRQGYAYDSVKAALAAADGES